MRYIKLENCIPGSVLAKHVYGDNGALLLRFGVVVTQKHINALFEVGYPGIYIHDNASSGIEVPEVIDSKTRNAANAAVKGLFSTTKLAEVIKQPSLLRELEEIIESITNQIHENENEVHNIVSLKTFDSYTYQHCVDVGILSIILGKALKMSDSTLIELGKAAIFHDIGKMFVPKEILNKPGRLTGEEFALMKKHPELGYECLKYALTQPEIICRGVLLHHEQAEGTGYPKAVKADKIPLFAKIIAVTDVYDAITSKRAYKNAMIASEAYEYIMSNSGRHFDSSIVYLFVRRIAPYPIGGTVVLSNGKKALVVENNPAFMMRPLVKILTDNDMDTSTFIDMALDASARSITIVGTM